MKCIFKIFSSKGKFQRSKLREEAMHKLMDRKADQEDKSPLIVLQLTTFPKLCKTSHKFLKYKIFRLCHERYKYQRTILHNSFLNLNRIYVGKKPLKNKPTTLVFILFHTL